MTEKKIIYQQFLKNKSVYNLNISYWRVKLQKALDEKISSTDQLIKNKNEFGKNYYDGNPIFSYYNSSKEKAIRVIQEDPSLLENIADVQLIEAWVTKIFILDAQKNEREIPELVVSLFLTQETADKCLQLAKEWFTGDLSKSNINIRLMSL